MGGIIMSYEMVRNAILKGSAIALGKTFVKGNKLFCYVYVKTLGGSKITGKFLLPAYLAYALKKLYQKGI